MVTNKVTWAVFVGMMLAVVACADPTVKVTFPEKGAYLYWLDAKGSDGKPIVTAPKRVAGDDAEIDLAPASPAGKLGKGKLHVYDPKTGNIAEKSLENLVGKKELKLKGADFDRIGRVKIVLRPANGKPDERVESAVVTLTDANSDVFTTMVDPTSEGNAEFRNIAAGLESVQVAYDGGKMTVEMEVPADRDEPVFTHEIVISAEKLRTIKVAAAQSSASEDASPAAKPKERPGRSGFLSALAGIIFIGMIAYVGYVVLKSKGVTVEGSLRKMGAEFPQDGVEDAQSSPQSTPTQQVDPSVCQFCGQKKDAQGNCACSVGASTATATGTPRLVGLHGPYAGRIFELSDAELTLGRDASNHVALADDGTSSRRHAKIDRAGDGFTVTDLGSSNGTFVNGAKVTGTQTINPGDEIQVGSTRFKFEI